MVQAAVDGTEADLLRSAQGGNLFAFEEIVRRYQRRVYSTALRIVRRHDLADDVTQEAFLRAHRALASYDGARPFGPWMCRIAANLAINHVRSPEAREEELDEVALAVRNYIHDQHGIALSRMELISYGETKPVTDNKSRANRAQNRRVVIKVLE